MNAAQSVQATFLQDCEVPKLTGKTLRRAGYLLAAHDCTFGKITHARSRIVKRGEVISQKPKAGTQLTHDAKISLVISRGKR